MKKTCKLCVYTCIMGDYETLNEQYEFDTKADFICFTDNRNLTSETWKIVYVEPIIAGDHTRNQRLVKLRPHIYLVEYDIAIYVDNSVKLLKSPEEICSIAEIQNFDLSINLHSSRERVIDEFLLVALLKYDTIDVLYEQLSHYLENFPEVLHKNPFWGGFFVTNTKSESVKRLFDIWSSYILRYSKRDQLSANLAFDKSQIKVNSLKYDNNSSPFHSWPHDSNRRQIKTTSFKEAYSLEDLTQLYIHKFGKISTVEANKITPDKNLIYGNLFIGSGNNSAGSGGRINFGIEELSLGLPMASIRSYLINADIDSSETQGNLEFFTRNVCSSSSDLVKRFTIRENGVVNISPVNNSGYNPVKGDIYIDKEIGKMYVCLKDGKWSQLLCN